MTPARAAALAARALGRRPTTLELDAWTETLTCPPQTDCPTTDCVHDNEGDQALRMHVATSNYPPTPSDVRKLAIGLANARVEAQQQHERQQAVAGAVPPTPEYLTAAANLRARMAERQRELDKALEHTPASEGANA